MKCDNSFDVWVKIFVGNGVFGFVFVLKCKLNIFK